MASLVTNGLGAPGSNIGAVGPNMTASDKPNSAVEQKSAERLDVAHTVYQALVAQDADRVITLCDVRGKLIARHEPRPEDSAPEIGSWR